MSTTPLPRVVILGAGFGGLAAARALSGTQARVTVVDRNNHHLFQPLLYQVATAGLAATDIATPIRSVLRGQKNADVLMAEVTGVDLAASQVRFGKDQVSIPFDRLVIATGAVSSYYGKPEWESHAPSLKDLSDALRIRERVLLAFERAEFAAAAGNPRTAEAWLTFVVVGGGPTGVEVAGSIAELAHRSLARDFRKIDPARARVILLEGGPRVLAVFPEKLSDAARARLTRMGVSVRTGSRAEAIDAGGISLVGGERIEANTVIWAAGVAASPVAKWLERSFETDRMGRIKVEPDLSLPGYPNVSVIGDAALVVSPAGRALPGLAPVALQQGDYVGRKIGKDLLPGAAAPEPFHYRDKGNLATVGRSFAVADLGKVRLSGRFAWLTWVVVHIFYLINFHNRLLVLFEWAWAYVTWQRGARLVTGIEPGLGRWKPGGVKR